MTEGIETKDQLLIELKAALDSGDFKAVAKVCREIDKMVTGEEKVAKDAKLAAVVELTVEVKKAMDKVVQGFVDKNKLDAADGVWYSYDFGDTLATCRLLKGAARTPGSGGGGGKKFSISTSELLKTHGSEMLGDTGKTFQQAYDELPTSDGQGRYNVRTKLLKKEGLV